MGRLNIPNLAQPDAGLVIANGIAQGASNFLNAQRSAQAAQYNRERQSAMLDLQRQKMEAETAAAREKLAPVDMDLAHIQLLMQAAQGGALPAEVVKPVLKDKLQDTIAGINTPEKAAYVASKIPGTRQTLGNPVTMASLNAGYQDNPNRVQMSKDEVGFASKMIGYQNAAQMAAGRNATQLTAAQMQGQNALDKLDAEYNGRLSMAKELGAQKERLLKMAKEYDLKRAQIAGQYGLQGAQARADATVRSAGIRAKAPGKSAAAKDPVLNSIMTNIVKAESDYRVDQDKSKLVPGLPADKAARSAMLKAEVEKFYRQYQAYTGKPYPGQAAPAQPAPAPQAPAVPAQPAPAPAQTKVPPSGIPLSWNQKDSAKAGDLLQAPNGKTYKVIAPGQVDPTPVN
jgi:hypothetical protein